MFEGLGHFFKKISKQEQKEVGSKDAAKERLHLVLMQDRANVSADFLELMKQEIIEVIEKYIVVDESQIDVRLTNLSNDDGTNGAPALFANIPIVNIKNDMVAEKSAEFEGIDINKEMGLVHDEKVPGEDEVEELHGENEEYDEESEEDDDDVTFDDLLKKAEEADRESKENDESQESENVEELKNEAEDAADLLKEEDEEEEIDETEEIEEFEYDDENVEEKKAFKKKNRRKKNR